MKKRLGSINVNVSNRAFYSILLLSISILVVSVVLAFGTTNPTTFGHSAKELDLSSGVDGNAVFNGNVGIGVSNPSARLDVAGELKVGNTGLSCDSNRKGFLRSNSADGNLEFCNGTVWGQVTGAANGGTYYAGSLVNGVHTGEECFNNGGVPYNIGGSDYVCRFTGFSTCPTGWTKYQQWTITTAVSCVGIQDPCSRYPTQCTTGSHNLFSNIAPETCSYSVSESCGPAAVCTATVSTIGCY